MTEVVGNIRWLVCPLVLVCFRVEEVYVYSDEEEYSVSVVIMLDKSWFRCKMKYPVWVCPVGEFVCMASRWFLLDFDIVVSPLSMESMNL